MEAFLYDFEKMIFGLTRAPSPLTGVLGIRFEPESGPDAHSDPKWLYLGELLADLDETCVKYY